MAWIEVHQALFTHRKTLALTDILDLPEVYVAAHLIALWTWALDNAPDGVLHVRRTIVARACQWSGDADALCDALIEAGFLEAGEGDVLIIHDWHDYAGRLVEKRRQNALRMREARQKQAPEPRATHVQRTLHARAGATGPNPTQPDPTPLGGRASASTSQPKPKPEPEKKAKRKTKVPIDFPVTEKLRAWAKEEGITCDLERETKKMINYFIAKGEPRADWDATWRNWMIKAEEIGYETSNGKGRGTANQGESGAARAGVLVDYKRLEEDGRRLEEALARRRLAGAQRDKPA